ncbi:MAG: 2-hydroxyacyl-CoA dehydratase family protein [Proteobacteria bacterium]|nr:2-hydroxyacyl-CoA dehydratase family protein [Pseudomonadota bacterium]
MRPEIKEYNFDWMLGSILHAAAKTADGSHKEYERLLDYTPYFKGILAPIMDEGKPGITFLKLFSEYVNDIVHSRDQGKKLAMTTFCFSPAIFHALNVVPTTLELLTALGGLMWKRGTFDYLDYSVELGLTETACSAQRGALGAYLGGLATEVDFIVCDTPGVCDTNANSFAFAASYLDKPYYQLNYPQKLADDRTGKYHIDDYKEMIKFLETHTGRKLDLDRLGEVLEEIKKQDKLVADLEDMHQLKPTPIPVIYNLFIYAGRFMYAGLPLYTKLLIEMVEAAKAKAQKGESGLRSGKEKLRAFMCYIDHYTLNTKFWEWLDDHGIAHMGGILSRTFADGDCYLEGLEGSSYKIDTSSMDSMLDSIAQMNARLPMVRSIRGQYDKPNMWLDETLSLVKTFKVDCVLYNGTPGCRNTWGMVKPFAMELEKNGYPTHIMNADAFDDRVESWEATKERLDEFFKVRGLI